MLTELRHDPFGANPTSTALSECVPSSASCAALRHPGQASQAAYRPTVRKALEGHGRGLGGA